MNLDVACSILIGSVLYWVWALVRSIWKINLLEFILKSFTSQWAAASERCEGNTCPEITLSAFHNNTAVDTGLCQELSGFWFTPPSSPTKGLSIYSVPAHEADEHEGLMFPSPWEPLRLWVGLSLHWLNRKVKMTSVAELNACGGL